MAKTNSGLLAYAKAQVGKPYWFGTFGQTASASLLAEKKKQYPQHYKASDFKSQFGKRVHDCAGLVKGYLWSATPTSTPKYDAKTDWGAAGFYTHAKKKGTIGSFPKYNGLLIFKADSKGKITHVAVYGDGYAWEAKGHAYGVVKTKYKATDWKYWCQCNLIENDIHPDSNDDSGGSEMDEKQYKVLVNSFLAVRSSPIAKNDENKVGELYNGAIVTVKEVKGNWARISGNCWCSMSYLKAL